MTRPLSLTVNGHPVEAVVEPRMHLADLVRDVLHLTGTHLGCEHGVCGACTVLVDGAPMRSCIAYAIACDGADIRTIEGFDDDPLMQALRHAFTRHHALQCGYCTPGMLITAHDIVRRLPGADEARVREELSGNLCRCTGYVGIVEAVRSVLATPPARGDEASGTAARPFEPLHGDDIPRTAPEPGDSVLPSGPGPDDETPRLTADGLAPPPRIDTAPPVSHASAGQRKTRDATSTDAAAATSTAVPDEAPAPRAPAMPSAFGSEHAIDLAVAPDTLWRLLQDIPTVVRCLPGASLAGAADADPLSLAMTVAIGPMRARFEGTAHVVFDDRGRKATMEGSGHDARSRSTSQGRIELSVRPSGKGGSVLTLQLRYALKGPLAQFSRGAIVDAVVEQILERFAANLASTAEVRPVVSSPPLEGIDLVVSACRKWLRRWLRRGGG